MGLGLASMGTQRADVYEQLKFHLYQDDAVTGEAAGLAMGLVMLGSGSTRTSDAGSLGAVPRAATCSTGISMIGMIC